jgi:cytoskeletal protein RodZ
VSDKSAAVLPITPRSRLASQKASSTAPRIAAADFGEGLLHGREQKKRSLEDIAATTKIGIHQLRALERGDLDRLPAGIYRRAIVRQYAQAVGLGVEQTLRDLANVTTDVDVDEQLLEPAAQPRRDAGSSRLMPTPMSSVAALVVLAVGAAATAVWYRASATAPAADVRVPAAIAPTRDADTTAIASAAATEPVRANAGDIELVTDAPVLQTPTVTADIEATEGDLRITSEPAGAIVTVNGVGWGPTPVTIRYMPFGKKLIRVTKPGYVSAQRGLDFVPGRRVQSVRLQLSRESPTAP